MSFKLNIFLLRTTLSFAFQGTSLEVHGLRDASGGGVIIQLDDQSQEVSTSSDSPDVVDNPSTLYISDPLDPATNHTVSISWFGGNMSDGSTGIVYFNYFIVTNYSSL